MFNLKLYHFSTEIMHRKPQFTAFGFFDIDNTLFLTVSHIITVIDKLNLDCFTSQNEFILSCDACFNVSYATCRHSVIAVNSVL